MANMLDFQRRIFEVLKVSDITALQIDKMDSMKSNLIQFVRSKAPACFKNYANAVVVASSCYAALLLESDEVGKKTREEFGASKRNIFGDTRLVQNALWLNSRILSNDGGVRRMVEYLALPEITMKGMI